MFRVNDRTTLFHNWIRKLIQWIGLVFANVTKTKLSNIRRAIYSGSRAICGSSRYVCRKGDWRGKKFLSTKRSGVKTDLRPQNLIAGKRARVVATKFETNSNVLHKENKNEKFPDMVSVSINWS